MYSGMGTKHTMLAVGTKSQYILQSIMSSGNLNDGKAAIPLLKGIENLPHPSPNRTE